MSSLLGIMHRHKGIALNIHVTLMDQLHLGGYFEFEGNWFW
jgi:hypothetical protein